MGERLAGGNVAVALLANTLATGAALVALILTFGPISGAHFNPAVTLADASQGGLPWREVPGYVGAQIAGAFAGVAAAHVMFELPLFFASRHARQGPAQMFSEFVATFGLLAVIWGCAARCARRPCRSRWRRTSRRRTGSRRRRRSPTPPSRSRARRDTFAGIRPADAPGFIVAQLLGAARRDGAVSLAGAEPPESRARGRREGDRDARMRLDIKTADELIDSELRGPLDGTASWSSGRCAAVGAPCLRGPGRTHLGARGRGGLPRAAVAYGSRRSSRPSTGTIWSFMADDEIRLAYPFSARRPRSSITLANGQERFACCATDALGLAAMLGARVLIRSRVPSLRAVH